jgi:hypothetical protein
MGLPRSRIDDGGGEVAIVMGDRRTFEANEVIVLSVEADRFVEDAGVCGVAGIFFSTDEGELNNALGTSFINGGGVAGIYMVLIGDLGGTWGRLSTEEVGECIDVGVLHSTGEKMGESGRVGLHK